MASLWRLINLKEEDTINITEEQIDLADISNFPEIMLEDGKKYIFIEGFSSGAKVRKIKE